MRQVDVVLTPEQATTLAELGRAADIAAAEFQGAAKMLGGGAVPVSFDSVRAVLTVLVEEDDAPAPE